VLHFPERIDLRPTRITQRVSGNAGLVQRAPMKEISKVENGTNSNKHYTPILTQGRAAHRALRAGRWALRTGNCVLINTYVST